MVRKKIALAIAVFMMAASVFAFDGGVGENGQKIYPVDSDVYEAIKYLYISQGIALPSTTGPWSAAELQMMLERIKTDSLDDAAWATYEFVKKEIGRDARYSPNSLLGFDGGVAFALEGYYHTNPTQFNEPEDFGGNGDYWSKTPTISIPFETSIGEFVYGYSSFDFANNRAIKGSVDLSDYKFYTNVILVPPAAMTDFNLTFPKRAFGSVGGDYWNFSIGRERMKWGPGESGNLVLGDQIPYHNQARFTAFTDTYKYTFFIGSYVHPMSYTELGDDGKEYLDSDFPYFSQDDLSDGTNLFLAHRLEWRIIDKVNFALTEAIMYQSETNKFDLTVLSPTAIFHNYYIRKNANSLLAFDVDYTPIKYLNVYSEILMDDINLGEYGAEGGPPNAMGFILGAKSSVPYGKGMFYGSLEGAYTDPYLYLRDDGSRKSDNYGINFVVAIPEMAARGNYKLEFLGYKYGNDSIVLNLKTGYKVFGSWNAELEYTHLWDGVFDENTRYQFLPAGSQPSAPTTNGSAAGSYDSKSNQSERNAIAHWNVINIRGSYNILRNFKAYGELTFVHITNYENISGRKAFDFQMMLGLSYFL